MSNSSSNARILKVLMTNSENSVYSETADGLVLSTFNYAVRSSLFKVDENLEVSPEVIKHWQWNAKEKTYIFTLDPNFRFHDGSTPNSKDLEFSLLRGFFSEKRNFYEIYLNNIEGVKAVKKNVKFKSGIVSGIKILNELTIQVKLDQLNPSFLYSLTRPYFSLTSQKFQNSDQITWKKWPVGVGSFKVVKEDEIKLTLESIDKLNKLSNILVYNKFDEKSEFDISFINNKIPNQKKFINKDPASIKALFFNKENELSKNINFRKAMFFTINRNTLLDGIESSSPSYQFLTTSYWHNKRIKDERDIDLAKSYIKLIPDGLKSRTWNVPVYSNSTELSEQSKLITSRLKKQLSEVGLDFNFYPSNEKFLSQITATKSPFLISGRVCDNLDPLLMFGSFRTNSAYKFDNAQNDVKFDELYRLAEMATDSEDRLKTMHALSNYTLENQFIIPISEDKVTYYFNPKTIKNLGVQKSPIVLDFNQINFQ